MTTGPMDPALWQPIVAASAEVKRIVTAVPAGAHLGADGMREVRAALDGLRTALVAAGLPERTAYEVIFPLVLHFDELVKPRLGEADAAAWPLLEHEIYDEETGGALFHELADRLLADPDGAQLTIAVLLYCLRNGFRAADDPEAAARTASRLDQAIARPALPLAGAAPVARDTARSPSASLYYAVSALLAAGAAAFLVFGS